LYKKVLNKFAAYLKLEKILCKYLDQINYNIKIRKKQSLGKTEERRWREMFLIVISIKIHLRKQSETGKGVA